MHLTTFTDHALRVLIYTGIKDGDELTTSTEIAAQYGISRNHVMKVVHELGRAGYLETVRGKHGGVRLCRDSASINLGAVVRRTEPQMHLVECFGEHNACRLTPACELMNVLGEALQAFLQVLDRYTLADLLVRRRAMAGLLRMDIPIHGSGEPPQKK